MDAIADRFADRAVRSVFVYTREAHPGELYRHHTSMEGKRENAKALREVVGITRSLRGEMALSPSQLPNMTWILGRGGLILYKSAWTDPEDVEDSLKRALDGLEHRGKGDKLPFYSERLSWRIRDDDTFRELLARCGPQAVSDFFDKRPKGK